MGGVGGVGMNDREMMLKIMGELGEIRESLKSIQKQLNRQDSDLKEKLDDHEARIRTLESTPADRWKHMVTTIIGVVVSGLVGAAIMNFLSGK